MKPYKIYKGITESKSVQGSYFITDLDNYVFSEIVVKRTKMANQDKIIIYGRDVSSPPTLVWEQFDAYQVDREEVDSLILDYIDRHARNFFARSLEKDDFYSVVRRIKQNNLLSWNMAKLYAQISDEGLRREVIEELYYCARFPRIGIREINILRNGSVSQKKIVLKGIISEKAYEAMSLKRRGKYYIDDISKFMLRCC